MRIWGNPTRVLRVSEDLERMGFVERTHERVGCWIAINI